MPILDIIGPKNGTWYQQILQIDEVTKTIVEDVTQVVSRMNYINNESDFCFTKEEQIVYEVLQKKKKRIKCYNSERKECL